MKKARRPRRVSRSKSIVTMLSEQAATYVLSESTRASIERMADDFARDMLKDKAFREYLRSEAVKAARAVASNLRRR